MKKLKITLIKSKFQTPTILIKTSLFDKTNA